MMSYWGDQALRPMGIFEDRTEIWKELALDKELENKLTDGNIANGIVLDYPLAKRYVQTHKCVKGCQLDLQNTTGHDFQVICPTHGIVTNFNQVKKWQHEQMEQAELRGQRDTQKPTGLSADELLKSLGF